MLVLHDLNHACRYSHHLVAMREGRLVAEGTPDEVVTEALVKDVFDLSEHGDARPGVGHADGGAHRPALQRE